VYSDYLHAFGQFLQFLGRHPEVGNEQTRKAVKLPSAESVDKTMSRVRLALARVCNRLNADELESSISGDGSCSVSYVDTEQDAVVIPVPATNEVASGSATVVPQLEDVKNLPVVVEQRPGVVVQQPVSVPDVDGFRLLGKKRVKNSLRAYCDEVLATHLVATDKISRVPEEFERQLDFLRRKSERHGGVMLGLNSTRFGVFSSMGNGRLTSAEYEALWNSS